MSTKLTGEGKKRAAFTLAETLITLAIIGIVGAMTIPGLITKLKRTVEGYQKTVMEAKLIQGLNMLSSQENGLNVSYRNTEEFVLALSKYLKMSTVCGKDNLRDCFAYQTISYNKNGESKQVDLDTITTANKLKLEDGFLDPAGFVLADGTPFIVSWNNNCSLLTDDSGRMLVDPDKALKSVPYACLDGIYDRSGTRKPNKFNTDVLPLANATIIPSISCDDFRGVSAIDQNQCRNVGDKVMFQLIRSEMSYMDCVNSCSPLGAHMMTIDEAKYACENSFNFGWWHWVNDGSDTSSKATMIKGNSCDFASAELGGQYRQQYESSRTNISCKCFAN
ncbi:type II secretion system protein [bacterium]|nr:type II secretion system protein [bacterium]